MPSADQTVIDALQRSASLHLTAIEHYASLAEHFDRWGYPVLGEQFAKDAEEERDHLRRVLSRLEFFDVATDFTHAAPAWPRHDVLGTFRANLSLEDAAATAEQSGILASRAVGDEGSAIVFASLLAGSEASIREIEATQEVIQMIGLDNYLANQT